MSLSVFGYLPDGTPVHQLDLFCGDLHLSMIDYGCTMTVFEVPDRFGKVRDILLGYPSLSLYQKQTSYMGALIGRYANRIANSSFTLEGAEYHLPPNDGNNHLHGGPHGYDKQLFQIVSASDCQATFSRLSPDGEAGYPGNLLLNVTYTLTETDLTVVFSAVSDRDTIHSFTLHPYFNLSGHGSGSVLNHFLQIFADRYTPVRDGCIPTGEIRPVSDTPFDFLTPRTIGERIDESCEQLKLVGGYDHNYVLNDGENPIRCAALVWSNESGIEMTISTTMPGMQFYSGNCIDTETPGKGGFPYDKRSGFCLEPQQFPDSPHHRSFPSPILYAGNTVNEIIRYSFGIHS